MAPADTGVAFVADREAICIERAIVTMTLDRNVSEKAACGVGGVGATQFGEAILSDLFDVVWFHPLHLQHDESAIRQADEIVFSKKEDDDDSR